MLVCNKLAKRIDINMLKSVTIFLVTKIWRPLLEAKKAIKLISYHFLPIFTSKTMTVMALTKKVITLKSIYGKARVKKGCWVIKLISYYKIMTKLSICCNFLSNNFSASIYLVTKYYCKFCNISKIRLKNQFRT